MIKRYKQFDQLVVDEFETDHWDHPRHNHTYFEVIFIAKGRGIHHLNDKEIPYRSGHLFLLGPEDEHEFSVEKTTRFVYFKFTRFYLDTTDVDNPAQWNKDVDLLLRSNQRKSGNILTRKRDVPRVKRLLNLIVEEYIEDARSSRKVIFQYFKGLVVILKRNLRTTEPLPVGKTSSPIIEELLEYIERHIYNPQMLTQKRIAENFHFSANYVGDYFKSNFGTSLKKYIQEYRFNLLEQRLKGGQTNTKQLVHDFGFTDVSHLHKFVKSVSGKSLTEVKLGSENEIA